MSWTVAPEARGSGVGKWMVVELAGMLDGPILAEIKEENAASIRIAAHVGMELRRRQDGVLYFARD
jgi:hypothetical protein